MEKLGKRLSRPVENRRIILNAIRKNGSISRIGLRKTTGLRLASITHAVRQLIKESLIYESRKVKQKPGKAGRNQVLLEVKPKARYAIGVELGYGFFGFLVLDLTGKQAGMKKIPCDTNLGKFEILKKLVEAASRFVRENSISWEDVVGLGFVDPGVVDVRNGISLFSSLIPAWRDVPTRQFLEKELPVKVYLLGTSQAMALAENINGAGKGYRDFLRIEYGEGIACGIVSGGTLIRGSLEMAGELGHCHFSGDQTPCHCGGFGCLEAICALPALAQKARTLIEFGTNSLLLKMAGGKPEKITGLMILDGFKNNDRLCQQILGEATSYLGGAISNAVNIFNPQLVILDKNFARAGDYFLEHLKHIVRRET
ncbi:MAG: ROK family transcriptional regulator, partial [Candidatus Omnitrophica bacterium]|nr:ROK family transcriptional regulator [Candidatus Omnitrophota bacterium]